MHDEAGLLGLTIRQLKRLARDYGLVGYSNMTKPELIEGVAWLMANPEMSRERQIRERSRDRPRALKELRDEGAIRRIQEGRVSKEKKYDWSLPLDEMPIRQLKLLAREESVPGYSEMRILELVEAIKEIREVGLSEYRRRNGLRDKDWRENVMSDEEAAAFLSDPSNFNLESLPIRDLKRIARQCRVLNYSQLNKAALVKAISRCSEELIYTTPRPATPEERFWEKVNKDGIMPCEISEEHYGKLKDMCWEWTGFRDASGYGKTAWKGKTISAHRVAYMLSRQQEIPEGMVIRHRCDNPSCVNPSHLELGTHKDNALDAAKRERNRGSVTNKTAQVILDLYEEGLKIHQISRILKISSSVISGIVNKVTYKHLHQSRLD